MAYDFDKTIERHGTNCVKWDTFGATLPRTIQNELKDPEILPMWVADMDFETAPCVLLALKERMEHGCFGYTLVPESYYEATIGWFKRRHGWEINRKSFIYTSGVVPAISAIIKGVVEEQGAGSKEQGARSEGQVKVLVQTPVYNCFFSCIRNNGCEVAESPLKMMGHRYEVDWEDFEKQCADPNVKVFLLCNPHNPAGRVWTREELVRMGEICLRNDVFVISDEIHCEFTMPGHTYTPYASLNENFAKNCAVCLSPSKAFNIAGLQIANIIVKDADIRRRVDKAININEVCDVNPFGVIALQAAYSDEGEKWLKELNEYIHGNYILAKEMLEKGVPQCPVTELEGTYLMWVNIAQTGKTSKEVTDHLLHQEKVYVNAGPMYGEKAGEGYIRINLATRRKLVEEGIGRIIRGIKSI
ncbi:MAG: pyridoxal phosphate-dependent aminotransferase [Bacteroidaceae bacterium]|nr:pyridoxal phosphate-dependent aminotransferase [Bacteroidaceae bacterium]